MADLKYEPYTGGGGPTEDQVRNNNQALKEMLEAAVSDIKITDALHPDYEDPTPIIIITKDNGEVLRVGYDRWGFCGEGDVEEGLDQAGLNETFDLCLLFTGKGREEQFFSAAAFFKSRR